LEVTRLITRSVGLRTLKDWTLWRGRIPPKQKERSHGVRARSVGAPATLVSFAPPLSPHCWNEKGQKKVDVCTPEVIETLSGNLLG
jgi:hypothetical protein